MSRVRTSHSPDGWLDEGGQAARIHSKAYSVPAETVGNMREILTQSEATTAMLREGARAAVAARRAR